VVGGETLASAPAEGEAPVGGGVGDRAQGQRESVGEERRDRPAEDEEEQQVEERRGDADGGEAAEFTAEPDDTAQVVERGADYVDARVGVIDPVDRDLVDAQAGALGEDESEKRLRRLRWRRRL
jgi:hypothetical protein